VFPGETLSAELVTFLKSRYSGECQKLTCNCNRLGIEGEGHTIRFYKNHEL